MIEREDLNSVSTQISSSGAKPLTKDSCSLTDENGGSQGFTIDQLRSEEEFKSWTGITKPFFEILVKLISGPSDSIKLIEHRLLMCLAKLKTNVSFSALAALFCINRSTISRIFSEVLDLLYNATKDLLYWLPKDVISARMPESYKEKFPSCRVINDATKVKCEKPKTLTQQVQMYSNYKSSHTVKFLIGIAPSGEIIFISKAFGGRVTDTYLTVNSGILELLEPGDVVLVDKGFPQIENDFHNKGSFLVMPPFKRGQRQFSNFENSEGYKCSSVRIHVERAVRRLKYFQVLSFLQSDLIPHVDKIIVVLSFICNNMPELIKRKE